MERTLSATLPYGGTMAIHEQGPFEELVRLRERLNRLVEDAISRSAGLAAETGAHAFRPPVDLIEQADRYLVRVDLPGVAPVDVDVEVEAGLLVVRGERRSDSAIPSDAYLRVERPQGPFAVEVTLPDSVNEESIEASHRGGVIEIVLPKREERRRQGRMSIRIK